MDTSSFFIVVSGGLPCLRTSLHLCDVNSGTDLVSAGPRCFRRLGRTVRSGVLPCGRQDTVEPIVRLSASKSQLPPGTGVTRLSRIAPKKKKKNPKRQAPTDSATRKTL